MYMWSVSATVGINQSTNCRLQSHRGEQTNEPRQRKGNVRDEFQWQAVADMILKVQPEET